jgi:hypothetical protein
METILRHRRIVTKAALLAATALCVSAATQAEPSQGFVLTAYPDAVGGQHLLAGHYSAALVQIRGTKAGVCHYAEAERSSGCLQRSRCGRDLR